VLYDWWAASRRPGGASGRRCAAEGAEVRAFNPPSLLSPLGWVHRDHRKLLVVDHDVAVVTGPVHRPAVGR
jgi:cardiolipin synthase A/B